jgi:hypothetical protein
MILDFETLPLEPQTHVFTDNEVKPGTLCRIDISFF